MITCKLSAILGERRIKVADLARDTGIARAVVDRWYHDRVSSFDRDVLSRLCDYLKVTPADLLQTVEQGKLF
ncbi:MAG: Cro/Cl family transcriptional regulator [Methylotenera sp.]|nr:MAG: Cro/Cl family transcriptional regulator [Methylotenera sp.]PPD19051.1 MAG: Cro/Cl family transcriptional regulator [Methylotenera sp.]